MKSYFKSVLTKSIIFCLTIGVLLLAQSCNNNGKSLVEIKKPQNCQDKKDDNPDKHAIWTPEQAARHQIILKKLSVIKKGFRKKELKKSLNENLIYGNGELIGNWKNRGPRNMPGAFKFAEMLDGTDIIYGVTHNHYPGEYNSKMNIFKGTVYNKTTGQGGDDFVLLTANWPNRYNNLMAIQFGQTTRLIVQIENGPLYYTDDDGGTWYKSEGLPSVTKTSIINRQDNNVIYVADDSRVYKSVDFGVSFVLLKQFGDSRSSFLYTPRYSNQPNSEAVYLARGGDFYKLNSNKTDFNYRGTYRQTPHGYSKFSVSGDERILYVTQWGRYFVSLDEGVTWSQKYPQGSWYGDPTPKMSSGKFLAVHPENPEIILGGYSNPVISFNGLSNVYHSAHNWGGYQNGTHLGPEDYYNRIRFNFHPDFQSSHFFYNSTGDLISVRCSDGGLFISYKEWIDFPNYNISGFDNSGYQNAHYINLNVLNTITPLIYRKSLFTGANNPNHINFSTQDQGSQSIIPGSSGDAMDFYQISGGDGPPLDSYDGVNVWKWERRGKFIYAPVKAYSNNGGFLSVGQISSQFNNSLGVTFPDNTEMGWVQNYIDRDQPDRRMWLLAKSLHRGTVNNGNITGHIVTKGTNQVAALAQAQSNPNKLLMLQDGNIFISNDRGTSFGDAIATPFSKTPGGYGMGDIGSGVVLPTNDNWVLFCGPSNNNVGAILSKDGGYTWTDVTGDFPSGNDAQTGGMVATPDGRFIFAGTDIGPYFFSVVEEKWYSIAEGVGFFNATDVDYVESINTVRFASWGAGILDFKINYDQILNVAESDFETDNLLVYPNPVKHTVFIDTKKVNSQLVNLYVLNNQGKTIIAKNNIYSRRHVIKLDVSGLSLGMYILKLTDNHGKEIGSKKIVID